MPLVLVHGGGTTIGTSFRYLLPLLPERRRIIEVGQGDAGDLASLLFYLGIGEADVLGFGDGGSAALQLAILHPGLVNKLVVISTPCSDFCDDELRSIRARALLLSATEDIITPEQAVRMSRMIAGSRLVIFPGRQDEVIGAMGSGLGGGYADVVASLVNQFLGPGLEASARSIALRADKSPVHPSDAPLR